MLESRTVYVPEGAFLDCFESGLRLTISYHSPTPDYIKQVKRGECQFRLVPYGKVLFLMSKFGSLDWIDSPFNIQSQPEDCRMLDSIFTHGNQCSLIVRIVLAGHDHGARMVLWSREFSSAFHALIVQQQLQHFDSLTYDLAVSRAYAAFPDAASMLWRSVCQSKDGEVRFDRNLDQGFSTVGR